MGYIYIYAHAPAQKTTFLTPPPSIFLLMYPNFLAFCLGLVHGLLVGYCITEYLKRFYVLCWMSGRVE